MNINDINPEKLVLIRWRDIVLSNKSFLDEDIERISPQFELVGRIKAVRRGLAVIQMEWGLMKDYEDEYDGDAGKETQIIPVGCIELVREVKLGKTLYTKEIEPDGHGPRERQRDGAGPNKPVEGAEL